MLGNGTKRAERTAASSEYRAALMRLASAQKSNRGAAGYSRWLNRRFGRHLAAFAYVCHLTPNEVTCISAAFTFPAITAIALFRPTWALALAVTSALLLGYAFDSADGQLARLQGGGSMAGEWLDHVLDALKVASIHIMIAICWFRFYGLHHLACLLIPLGFSIVATAFLFALMLSDMLRRVDRVVAGRTSVASASVDPGEAAPILRSLIVLPNDYGVLCLAVLLLSLRTPFMVVYAVLFAANAVFLVAGCVRWFREMTALGARGRT